MKLFKVLVLLVSLGLSGQLLAKGSQLFGKIQVPPEFSFTCKDKLTQKNYQAKIEIDFEDFAPKGIYTKETTGVLILIGVRDYIHYIEDLKIVKDEGFLRAGYQVTLKGSNPKGDSFSYRKESFTGIIPISITESHSLSIKDFPNLDCK